MKEIRKFGIRDQIGYVCGDMAGSFVNLYVDAFFLTFCTYVLGIKAAWMGSMFLFARLWDAFNDPMIGSFPDRWQIGKSGDKFKPYIKIAMIPLAISGLLCFADVSSWGSLAKHVWVVFAYIVYGMSYTGTSMPFGSMASVVTNDPIERTKLSRARSIGGTIVGIGAISLVPQFVFNKAGEVVPSGFFKVAVVFGILSMICYCLLLHFTTERVRQPKVEGEKFNYGKVLKSVFKNRPMLGFFPLIPKLSQKYGKRNVILVCSGYNLVISLILFMMPIQNVYLFLVINTLATSGQTAFTMLIWAFVTDCIDYHEYQTGERSDGSLYSIYTFSRKIGSTLASTIASFSLGAIGYISGIEAQTAAVAGHIRSLCTFIPVATCVLELLGIGLVYNLTNKKTTEMYAVLKKRRDEGEKQA